MRSLTFDRFELGIDLRKGKSVADANRLRALKNAYVTSGWAVRKRPGVTKVADLSQGSSGLHAFDGKLHTFSGGNVNPAHPPAVGVSIENHQLSNPDAPAAASSEVHYVDVFNGALYVALGYSNGSTKHHYISGAAPYHVTDAKCPHSNSVVKIASKMWAIDGDTVAFSATNSPADWSTAKDAGYLPTGLQAPGTDEAMALGEYSGQLCTFMRDAILVWYIDPDPDRTQLEKVIKNIGTQYPLSIHQVSTDLFFLADFGYRSIAQQKYTDNLEDVDVGTPIDSIVVPRLSAGTKPVSTYYSGAGQYWSAIGSQVDVFSYSRSSKVRAWSTYDFGFPIDDFANLGDSLYMRSGDTVYKLDEDAYTDDGSIFDVEVLLAYQSAKKPGIDKFWMGCDVVIDGEATLEHLHDPNDESRKTIAHQIVGNSRPLGTIPVEVTSTEIAPRIVSSTDGPFQLDEITYYFKEVGLV